MIVLEVFAMSFLKDAKNGAILCAVLSILLGLLFILFPTISAKLICYILVAVLFVLGIRSLVMYFQSPVLSYFPSGLLGGLLLLAAALVLLLEAAGVSALLPAIFGAAIVISGAIKLCHAFELKRFGWAGWPFMLGASILGIVFGLLMLINPFAVAKTVMILIGCGLVYSGVSDLAAVIVIAKYIRDMA